MFNGGENYGDLKRKKSALKENFDYFFGNSLREDDSRQDFLVYLYYDGGNPAEVFDAIDLCMDTKIITNTARGLTNVHLNNLELRYGRGPFWAGWSKDLKMSYCVCEWSGGFADSAQPRMGGGSGCYGSCDGFEYDYGV